MKIVLAFHNLVLCVWSLVMFIGCLYELVQRARREDGNLKWFVCEDTNLAKTSGPLYFWSYIYYTSKYYELFDTVITLLKGSRPTHMVLHVFHHTVVILMAWCWLTYRQSLQFPGLLFNTFVHVVMYYYFFRRAMGWACPWKNWVTRLQIVQFMTSLVLFCCTMYFWLYQGEECSGIHALFFNLAFNVTLLWQFILVLLVGKKSKKQKSK